MGWCYPTTILTRRWSACARASQLPTQGIITPAPPQDAPVIQQKIEEAAHQPTPTKQELCAEDYLNRALALNDNSDEEIAYYTEDIRLNPQYATAYTIGGLPVGRKATRPGLSPTTSTI